MKGGSGEIFCTWAPWSNESRYQIIVKTVRECYGQTSHAVAEHQVTLWLLQVVCCKVLELKLFGTSPFCELLDWRGGIFFFFFEFYTALAAYLPHPPHTTDLAKLNTLYTAAYLSTPPRLDLEVRYLSLCGVVWMSRCLPTRWNNLWTHPSWHGWVQ